MKTIKPEVQNIISEILNPTNKESYLGLYKNLPKANENSLIEIATLIHEDRREEDFQAFFSNNPTFLFKLVPSYGDANVGMLIKLPIGNKYVSDFAVFTLGQGGCKITLIEIEKPSDSLFTKNLTLAKKLNGAITQVTDWTAWITQNKLTFIRDSIALLKKAPKIGSLDFEGNFKTMDDEDINASWNAFHGFSELCSIQTLIIIGRWSILSENERERLIYLNSAANSIDKKIRTYDQVIRKSYTPHET